MLEPFDAAKATRDIVAHFEDLTKAHEAVQRAQAQLGVLTPLIADCDAHDKVAAEIAALTTQREALRYYFADHKLRLAEGLLSDLYAERTRLTVPAGEISDRLRAPGPGNHPERRARRTWRRPTLGDRPADRRIGETPETASPARPISPGCLKKAGLDPVTTAEHFAARRGEIAAARAASRTSRTARAARPKRPSRREARGGRRGQRRAAQPPGAQEQHPRRDLELRTRLCHELRLTEVAAVRR